jgi:cytidylate kinase
MDKHIIINIGRQFGSGGKSVASSLGAKLGIQVYDNELIIKAAAESGFSPELFRRSDEKKRIVELGFQTAGLNDREIFKIQSKVIRDIAQNASAIFVGRASDYVLRDMNCLDVFITAPDESRRARICDRMGVSDEEASKLIVKMDKGRESYYNFFTFSHWGVASNYDLCVDSSILGIDGTADFIVDFARRAGKL